MQVDRINITQAAEKLLVSPDFDVHNPTVIFLHGFLASADGEGAKTVTKALVSKGGMNVLALDSSSILSFIYFKSSTCVRFIGKQLGHVLAQLVKGNTSVDILMVFAEN